VQCHTLHLALEVVEYHYITQYSTHSPPLFQFSMHIHQEKEEELETHKEDYKLCLVQVELVLDKTISLI